jgi:hypothetical protein
MRKHLFYLGTLMLSATLLNVHLAAQNTSPYWSLAGNSNASSTISKLGTTNAINLRLFTNNIERVHINYSNGYVGIGTTAPTYKLHVSNTANAIYGYTTGTTSVGVWGQSPYRGVYGNGATGVYGSSSTTTGYGVYGRGGKYGVYGISASTSGYGVYGNNSTTSGIGVYGNGGAYGVYGTGGIYGVYGASSGGYAIYGNSTNNYGGYIYSNNSDALDAISTNGNYGVWTSAGNSGSYGVVGYGGYIGTYGSGGTYGAEGNSYGGNAGVYGEGYNAEGGYFHSTNNWGLVASSDSDTYAGVFYGVVWSSGGFSTSDRRLKKNIEDFNDAIRIINKLQPKYYEFKTDAQYTALHLPTGMHYGLIAQDVEQLLPNLVHTEKINLPERTETIKPKSTTDGKDENLSKATAVKKESMEVKALNYTELIPVMIKAMQEQQQQIGQLKDENNDLIDRLKKLEDIVAKNGLIGNGYSLDAASLEQNTPNPFNNTTIIRYHLSQAAGSAKMVITDMNGKTIKTISLTRGDNGQLTLNSGALAPGSYNYTLWIDGKQVDNKKMVITK